MAASVGAGIIERVELAKWPDGKLAPVIFMIDDLTDAWVDANNNGRPDPGEDWGYLRDLPGSSFAFLAANLLREFPDVKVTFFVPVGRRSPVVLEGVCPMHAWAVGERPEFGEFLRAIARDPRFEIAYHGTDHGLPGATSADFLQEWLTFNSVEEAIARTAQGVRLFEKVLGFRPKGGKYCGYASNEFSDASVDRLGLLWWCRAWAGEDQAESLRLEPSYFGENKVVDIPSTVSGGLLTSLCRPGGPFGKRLAKRLLKHVLISARLRRLDRLVRAGKVVSIQEHISPARNDGRRQAPNIFDDLESLRRIFRYIGRYDVWYCTCTELAEYFVARSNVELVVDRDRKGFTLNYAGPRLTTVRYITAEIKLQSARPKATPVCLCSDNLTLESRSAGVGRLYFNVPLSSGHYFIRAC